MSKAKRSDSLQKKHWSIKAHESRISRNAEGNFCLNVEGGAEAGFMPYVGEIRQDRINYQSGKVYVGEIILEVNNKRVPGMIKKDVIALIKKSADPVSLVTTKPNATITKDLRQYLATRFTKNSVDSELQHQIRENLHMRVVPCTTRPPQNNEQQGVDYNFISPEEFKRMEKNGDFLESGVFEGHFFGTPKPPPDPPASSVFPTYPRSPANAGYLPRDPVSAPSDVLPSVPRYRSGPTSQVQQIPRNLGPLPPNWEIAYTENNEKYFIDHNTGTTHWMDPRLAHMMKHTLLDCEDNELPYGWEKVVDPMYGTYYIDHINRRTQYENPVSEAKRRYAGAQLPQRTTEDRAPPPLRAPPTMQSAAALEKQREAEAAAKWPEAGLSTDYPDYPNQQLQLEEMGEQDLEAELQGEVVKTTLLKTAAGFGFTIIGGDRPGELLQIKTIQKGSAADKDGVLQVGDVIVYINGISVLNYNHHKVVDLFKSIPMGSTVTLEVRRGYPLPDYQDDKLPPYTASSNPNFRQSPAPPASIRGESNGVFQQTVMDRLSINIVKGPLGFGFSLGESSYGPVVKQIMDHPRCAQLREGDIIVEVNGEPVHNYAHSDLVSVLKRCPKGNQANFVVKRPVIEELPNYEPGEYLPGDQGMEPFTLLEVHLIRQVSGFGFRIIGGREEGSQATIGAIVPGGAADLDGRLQIGDEITHINLRSVMDAAHQEVINYMGEAAAQGEVTLKIRRKVPPLELNPTSYLPAEESEPLIPQGLRKVIITRPNAQTSFGFVLQSNVLRPGCIVCRLVPGSPADQCGQLYQYDELVSVNGQDVSHMDHSDVVTLIKASGTIITLEVQQPQDLELVKQQQMLDQPPPQQAVAVAMDSRGRSYSGNANTFGTYPGNASSAGTAPLVGGAGTFTSQYSVNNGGPSNLQYTGSVGATFPRNNTGSNYPSTSGGGGGGGLGDSYNSQAADDDAGPQISANLDGFASDEEDIQHIEIHRDSSGFGFSIRGGAEYNAPLCVLRMAPGGAAERDGRLRVGDELLEINGNSTEGMGHADAITIIKHGGDIVKLTVRRLPDSLSGPGTPTKGSSHEGTPGPHDYMNSLNRNK